jgi:hypothetical protein
MPTLSITKTYADAAILSEADLDAILTSIETFVNSTKLDNANIQSSGIITANIANLAVTTAKIDDLAVTTGKLNDLAVTTAKINSLAVTTAKIDSLAVTTAKIANDAVTADKVDETGDYTVNSITSPDVYAGNNMRLSGGTGGTTHPVLEVRNNSPLTYLGNMVIGSDANSDAGYRILAETETVNAGATDTITFSIAFTSSPIVVVSTISSASWNYGSVSTTGFQIQNTGGAPATYHWIAYGRYT